MQQLPRQQRIFQFYRFIPHISHGFPSIGCLNTLLTILAFDVAHRRYATSDPWVPKRLWCCCHQELFKVSLCFVHSMILSQEFIRFKSPAQFQAYMSTRRMGCTRRMSRTPMNEGDFSKRDAFVLLDADYPIIMDTNQCLGYFSKFPRPLTTNAKGLYKTGLVCSWLYTCGARKRLKAS